MLEKDLSALKEKLISAKEFADVGNFFFDIQRNEEFFKSGKKIKNSMLKGIVQAIVEKLTGKKDIVLTHFLMIKIEKYKFWHGGFFVDGKPSGMFYFEEIDMGMTFVPLNYPHTSFVRFSALRKGVEGDPPMLFAMKGSDTIH